MDESTRDKLLKLRNTGLVIPDDLPDEDLKRLANLSEKEIEELARIFGKVGGQGPHFRVHHGRPPSDVQKRR